MCHFEKSLSAPASQVLERVRRGFEPYGGSVQGDDQAGTLMTTTPLGSIEGRYQHQSGTLSIWVDKKPRLVPCSAIEAIIDRFL